MPPADSAPFASHLQASLAAFGAHDLATAARCCDAALTLAPDHTQALHLRALIHLRQGEPAAAERYARRAVAADDGRAGPWCALAQACRQQRRHDEAAGYFHRALACDADHLESLAGLAAVATAAGRGAEAIDCHRRIAALRPEIAAAHYNLGRALEDGDELPEAAQSYRRALALDAAQPHAWLNLGGVAAQLGDRAGAIEAYRRAIALRPDYAAAHNNLGTVLQAQRDFEAATPCFREAIRLDPRYAEAHCNLGAALRQVGRTAEAEAAFAEALRLNPGYESARFSLELLRGANPARTPEGVVRALFDDYAAHFDAHLVDGLGYRIPERLAKEIAALRGADARLDVLDLGCGTGLLGAALGRLAARVAGVDLSARMLGKARERGGYDRLVEADIETFLRAERDASCDLVAAADVFVYLGALDAVFAEVARVLRPGGLFAFSVEALAVPEAEGYRVQPSGRYAHDVEFLKAMARRNAMTTRLCVPETIRTHSGQPVPGWVAVFEKPG